MRAITQIRETEGGYIGKIIILGGDGGVACSARIFEKDYDSLHQKIIAITPILEESPLVDK